MPQKANCTVGTEVPRLLKNSSRLDHCTFGPNLPASRATPDSPPASWAPWGPAWSPVVAPTARRWDERPWVRGEDQPATSNSRDDLVAMTITAHDYKAVTPTPATSKNVKKHIQIQQGNAENDDGAPSKLPSFLTDHHHFSPLSSL